MEEAGATEGVENSAELFLGLLQMGLKQCHITVLLL